MSVIRFDNVTKTFGGDYILEKVSFRIEERERVGLVGRNGCGKSTIFRLITGEIERDGGEIERMRRARIACLAQLPSVPEQTTIFDVILHSFNDLIEMEVRLNALEEAMAKDHDAVFAEYSALQDEFTRRGGYDFRNRVRRVLHGLGFSTDEFNLPFHCLSGGQRTRLMLALVLLQDADVLLLDEPENHLDLRAREWLEDYMVSSGKTIVVISHDRRLLNNVAQRILDLERGELRTFTGNYDAYLREKELIREQQQKAFERQQEFLRKEQAWIEKFRYKNTKARQVQSRIKRIEKMEVVEAPPPEGSAANFHLGEVVRSGAVVLAGENLGMAYGPLRLYDGLNLEVQRGERIGIIGPNGSGKTTLLRHLAGRLEGGGGAVRCGHKVELGYYDQHHDMLNPSSDILNEVWGARPELTPEKVRTFLGKLLFTGDDVFKPIAALSGGERSRVALAQLMLGNANVLLLDEPTNHLDIASRQALEGALAAFQGAIVMVSHDRELIDRIAGRLIIIEGGRAEVFLGNYAQYHQREQEREAAQAAATTRTADVLRVRAEVRQTQEKNKEREREARRQRRRLEQLEADIEAMEEVLAGFDARFAAIDFADYKAAQAAKDEYDGLKADLKQLYAEWEEVAEQMPGA